MRIIISTIGTSILTNQCEKAERSIININSNLKKNDYSIDNIELLNRLEQKASISLRKNPYECSAELNGLLRFYDEIKEVYVNDMHWLISTDTYQGEVATELIKNYLNEEGVLNVQIFSPEKLSTKNKANFLSGIKSLLKWCDSTLQSYQEAGYEIIFNLTGGFKSLQGYMNTIGMFYANKIVYVFEGSNDLIEIPKLPILIDEQLFTKHSALFLQLAQNRFFPKDRLRLIPDTLLEEVNDEYLGLSAWGELSWNKVKENILGQNLIELPFIKYEDSFKVDYRHCNSNSEKAKLQEVVAKVSVLLQDNNGDTSCLKGGRGGGLLYDNYSGKNKAFGHFRINKSDRVTCQLKNEALYLRHFGSHDYTERNP